VSCGADAQAERPLDLHEGIRDPRASDGCARWPESLRLLNLSTGELVAGRCRATNLCRYCQTLYVVETVEMLTLDAVEYAPTLWVVLTAREHLTRAECTDHLRQLRKAVRGRWVAAEWFVQVEFQKRGALHLNLLVKGVPVEDLEALHGVVVERWCSRVDARPVGQWSGVIEDGVGTVRYLSKMLAHGLKVEQRPPIGWRGHRTSQTRGYLVRPASVMREEARRSLRVKRLIYRGVDAALAELEVDAAASWELVNDPAVPADPPASRWADTGRRVLQGDDRAPAEKARESTSVGEPAAREPHPGNPASGQSVRAERRVALAGADHLLRLRAGGHSRDRPRDVSGAPLQGPGDVSPVSAGVGVGAASQLWT
jgi:hypothetical protein